MKEVLLKRLSLMRLPQSLDDPNDLLDAKELNDDGLIAARFGPTSKSPATFGQTLFALVVNITEEGKKRLKRKR